MDSKNTILPIICGLMWAVPILMLVGYLAGKDCVTEHAVVELDGGYAVFIDTEMPKAELEALMRVYIYPNLPEAGDEATGEEAK